MDNYVQKPTFEGHVRVLPLSSNKDRSKLRLGLVKVLSRTTAHGLAVEISSSNVLISMMPIDLIASIYCDRFLEK